jgi:AcrR family transcriptional regulator
MNKHARTESPARTRRSDWQRAAMDLLIREGIGSVKVLTLAERLGCARSSFYWFYASRKALLDDLLVFWADRNTGAITSHAGAPSDSITRAVLHLFRCWVDPGLFDAQLDFAIREWARRDAEVLAAIQAADTTRITAITAMFRRHGFAEREAFVRARILYFTQIGYYALVKDESLSARQQLVQDYVTGFTGKTPSEAELADFDKYVKSVSPELEP